MELAAARRRRRRRATRRRAALPHRRQRRRRQEHADRPPAVRQPRHPRRPARRAREAAPPAQPIDLSLLTDGLEAEREQGITIDVAYRYFATAQRKFIIADAPGHEQYTRNMVTAAAGSDAAVVLVDITKLDVAAPAGAAAAADAPPRAAGAAAARAEHRVRGQQARRGGRPGAGLRRRARRAARLRRRRPASRSAGIVPVSALRGDNVTTPSAQWPWYDGPTLLQLLERLPAPRSATTARCCCRCSTWRATATAGSDDPRRIRRACSGAASRKAACGRAIHGSGTCTEDVFLSNGVPNAPAPVHTLAANIVAASTARAGSGPVINARVFDSTGGCDARGTDNMQMRFASGRSHATICPAGNGPIGPSRFIHIEQRRTVRRAPTDRDATPGVNRAVVVNGIVATFP